MQKKCYIVTTAIEATWPKDHSMLFVGEWCKLYNRKHKWEECNYSDSPYHWNDESKYAKDFIYLGEFSDRIMDGLVLSMNKLYSIEKSRRYWEIVLGAWVKSFIYIVFDKWSTLHNALDNNNITHSIIVDRSDIELIMNDSEEFESKCGSDEWNEIMYGYLIKTYFSNGIDIEYIDNKIKNESICIKNKYSFNIKRLIKEVLFFVGGVVGKFQKKADYFLINSYLPLLTSFKFQIRLGQFPILTRARNTPKFKKNKRKWAIENFKCQNEFENILCDLIPKCMPAIYLEGFFELEKNTNEVAWPENPKIIFTSSVYGSDFLNHWIANKVESGSKLIIGQHGGEYGTSLFNLHENHETSIADKWLSWGWFDNSRKNIVPLGVLKLFGQSSKKHNPNGNVIMVGFFTHRHYKHLASGAKSSQWLDYFKDQINFTQRLPDKIFNQLLIKLGVADLKWEQESRWKDQFSNVKIYHGNLPLKSLIHNARIVISTYNSTNFLEMMAWNIPVILFCNPNHWKLHSRSRDLFKELKAVGIYHDTPEDAAKHLIKIWDNVDLWWGSNEVQKARGNFCRKFSYMPEDPLAQLESIFYNTIK